MPQFPNGSVLKVHDIFAAVPEFLRQADTIFSDIPYNQSLLSNYSNRPEARLSPFNTKDFKDFTNRFFYYVVQIEPGTLFIETGKEALPDYLIAARGLFKYVTFYNATYYHQPQNKSYIIHATNDFKRRRYTDLEDMDEAEAIAWICQNHPYECIGDLCMGKGLVGKHAYLAGKRFVGIDINPARLQVLVDFIKKEEAKNGATPRLDVG